MRYSPIDNTLFKSNRERLSRLLLPQSLCVLNANDEMPANADGTFPFKQSSDLFFLSGIDQKNTTLILFPDAPEEKFREILFIQRTNETIATWEGKKLSKEEAAEVSGIKQVYWQEQFEEVFYTLVYKCENLYLNTNEHLRAEKLVASKDERFIKWCKQNFPLHTYKRLAPLVQQLRMIKQETEIKLIKQACNITQKAFERILPFVKTGVMEFEIEAEITHEFIINRADGHAYAPIVASGKNACILHYTENNSQCRDGDMILLDFGAEYAHYASDCTRTIPVNGTFTSRQKEIYNAVLSVQRQAIAKLTPGNNLKDYNEEVGKLMEEELTRLGLLKAEDIKKQSAEKPLYKRYFMHGTSHFLGLDTHDVGDRYANFQEGMVFTCEPGIYIPEEETGIRLENDIYIGKNGPEDLMKDIVIEANEIENNMNKN